MGFCMRAKPAPPPFQFAPALYLATSITPHYDFVPHDHQVKTPPRVALSQAQRIHFAADA